MNIFGKSVAALALGATALSMAVPAQAHERWGRGGGDDAAIAVGAGLLGLAVGAAIASGDNGGGYYGNEDYYNSYPQYYGGYGYYNNYPSYGYYYNYPIYRQQYYSGNRGYRGGYGRGWDHDGDGDRDRDGDRRYRGHHRGW